MANVLKINARNLSEAVVRDIKEHYGDAELEIRVHESSETTSVLDEDAFWALIALLDWTKAEDDDLVAGPLVEALSNLPVAKIYQFYDRLSEQLWQLDTRAHADAMMRNEPDGYFSADEFLYARCCVVANGQTTYQQVLTDPSSFPISLTFEALLYIAGDAYQRKTTRRFTAIPAKPVETGSNQEGWKD